MYKTHVNNIFYKKNKNISRFYLEISHSENNVICLPVGTWKMKLKKKHLKHLPTLEPLFGWVTLHVLWFSVYYVK